MKSYNTFRVSTCLLYYYEARNFIIDIRYFKRSKSGEFNIILRFMPPFRTHCSAFIASGPRVGPIDDQLCTRSRWACGSRNWASRPSFLPVRLFPITSLVKEKEERSVGVGGWRCETRKRAAGFKGQRGKGWIDEVYWSSTRFRKPSAYHIIVTLLNTA